MSPLTTNVDTMMRRGLAIILVAVPLVPFHFINVVAGIRFIPFVFILALLLYGTIYKKTSVNAANTALAYLFILRGLALAMGALGSPDIGLSLAKFVFYFATGELVFILVILSAKAGGTGNGLIKVHLTVSAMVATVAIAEGVFDVNPLRQWVFHARNPLMTNFSQITLERSLSTLGNPNPLGTYLIIAVPVLLAHCMRDRHQAVAAVGLVIVLAGVFFSFSRGAWIALACSCTLFFSRFKRTVFIFYGLAAVLTGTLVINIGTMAARPSFKQEYIEEFYSNHRMTSYNHAVNIWKMSPLLGVGTGVYPSLAHPMGSVNDTPDNMYLLLLAESGLIGFITLLLMLILVLGTLYTASKQPQIRDPGRPSGGNEWTRVIAWAFIASIFGFSINMLSWDALYFPTTRVIFWLWLGIAFTWARAHLSPETINSENRKKTPGSGG
jgi:hypothetical protein